LFKNFEIYRDYGVVDHSKISEFEIYNGVKLPSLYKELLSKHDAVWFHNRDFNLIFKGEVITRDVTFFGFGDNLRKSNQIHKMQQEEYSHEGIIVFGQSCEGDYICFDYRANPNSNNPPVVLMLHDYPDDDGKLFICTVSDSFESFLSVLRSYDE